MQAFTDFQLQVREPPNPVRALDNSLTAAQTRGKNFYTGNRPADGVNIPFIPNIAFSCNGCHVLDPSQGAFGTGKRGSFEGIVAQMFKIPHLRNMYAKVGMFGFPANKGFDAADTGDTGNQIRGFGFTNDGAIDTMFRFFNTIVFHPQLNAGFPLINPDATRRDVEQYVLAFDSDLAPIVGQQVTLTSTNASVAGPRISLLEARAAAAFTSKVLGGTVTECDLVARVAQAGAIKGFVWSPSTSTFTSVDGGADLSDAALRALAATAGQEVTFTCTPPGSGTRIASTR